MYKDYIMNEMEGKSLPSIKQQQQISAMNEDRAKALDSLV
jgi:hypothetical protein